MVVEGIEREKKFLRQCGREDSSTASTPSEAGGSDLLSNSDLKVCGRFDTAIVERLSEAGSLESTQVSAGCCGRNTSSSPAMSSDGELSSERGPTEAPADASASGLPPELPLLDRYVLATLVFGAYFLMRIGHLDSSVFDELLQELRALSPGMADAFEHTSHCTISFLTDTTSMKLIQQFLAHAELSPDTIYNAVRGQTILPSWRKHEALGPFSAETPPTPEDFRARHEQQYPRVKAVVPSHLKQGVFNLLGSGSEIDARGRFAHELAEKIPGVLDGFRRGDAGSIRALGLQGRA